MSNKTIKIITNILKSLKAMREEDVPVYWCLLVFGGISFGVIITVLLKEIGVYSLMVVFFILWVNLFIDRWLDKNN